MEGKFRAWNKKENTWFNLTDEIYLSEQGDVMRMEANKQTCEQEDQLRFCDSEPEFYIGFDDKNGNHICQKDYVEVNGDTFLIDWRGCGFWFIDVENGDCLVFDPKLYDIEIIGNVHENPEIKNK